MARIMLWTGNAAVARVFVASKGPDEKRLKVYLAQLSNSTGLNIFLKKIYKAEPGYFAVIAIETDRYMEAVRLADEIEKSFASALGQPGRSVESLEQ